MGLAGGSLKALIIMPKGGGKDGMPCPPCGESGGNALAVLSNVPLPVVRNRLPAESTAGAPADIQMPPATPFGATLYTAV